MSRLFSFTLLLLMLVPSVSAQKYRMVFEVPKESGQDSILFIARHYRDQLLIADSAVADKNNAFVFAGNRHWETGNYALVSGDRKKSLMDFTIDGSQRFTIRLNSGFGVTDPQKDIVGSTANQVMYTYINRVTEAKRQVKDIEQRKRSPIPTTRNAAEKEMAQLTEEMTEFEKDYFKKYGKYRFVQLVDMFNGPEVPDEVEDKTTYYITHYWDDVDLKDRSLVYTSDLFNKMSLYFFNVLYHADKDTICKYADMVLQRVEDDTLMLRYFMDYIMPRYYRSTKNIGWDATWCYLVRKYYLTGKCAWASQSEISNKRQSVEFLEKSLIGAMGAELWMADTNQSADPKDWISSHRFPQKYVILWFWDPDCHHCQEQTAELKRLYDSLTVAGNKIFEVYAIGYEADVAKWKKYVREHQLPFVNVGGSNVNIDYQEAYNVHGAPTMIILNEERRIIMNKVIPAKNLLTFLDRYEKRTVTCEQ